MPESKIPADVERYVQEHKDQGMDEGKAWAIAWSRYCRYKNPGSSHCHKDEYFSDRTAGADPLRIIDKKIPAKSGGDIGLWVLDYNSKTQTYIGSPVIWTTGKVLGILGSKTYTIQDLKEMFDIRGAESTRSLFASATRLAYERPDVRSVLLPVLSNHRKS